MSNKDAPRKTARLEASSNYPLVVDLFYAIDNDPRTLNQVADSAGVYRCSVRVWKTGRSLPSLALFDAMARAVGLKLMLVPIDAEDPIREARSKRRPL